MIPFLLVAVLGLLLHGRTVMEDISLVSDAENATFRVILVIFPLVVLLLVYLTTQSLVLPLVIMLVIYTLRKMIIGPFLLILIIYLLSVYAPSYEFFQGNSHQVFHGGDRSGEYGLGCVLLLVVFLALHGMFSQGGSHWGLLILAVLFFIFTNFNCSSS